jgi:acetyl-CoA carboxylase biotin carboxyl carrier protein
MTFSEIKELIELFDKSELSSLNIKDKDFRIELQKGGVVEMPVATTINTPSTQQVSVPVVENREIEVKEDKVEADVEYIKSPMVGTFYEAPSPDSPPYVRVGDKVRAGQVVCIVEAMKIMNEIQAEFDCEILEVLVENGQAVEFDTPLFKVKRV